MSLVYFDWKYYIKKYEYLFDIFFDRESSKTSVRRTLPRFSSIFLRKINYDSRNFTSEWVILYKSSNLFLY